MKVNSPGDDMRFSEPYPSSEKEGKFHQGLLFASSIHVVQLHAKLDIFTLY